MTLYQAIAGRQVIFRATEVTIIANALRASVMCPAGWRLLMLSEPR